MTYDTIYWLILGASFVLTGIVGVLAMKKTGKLLISFTAGSLVNLLVIGAGWTWWSGVFAGSEMSFSRLFGLFGFGVCWVNNEVLLIFAQLIMKRKVSGFKYKPDNPDDL
ncbi:hypothetical protein O9H85_06050 [Paenibacillus filicis]|uniref:Uncharacterized protein n=1 Tax=Paenibacillus gyeongsangnamensis TaxID=3388067 RepID=A0ABT4Q593_9BACL|nr:hypothetical protein [Paenibacillus filicis]MCZ8511993.1 hypothetical protein [Paenibacillus filicis]